MDERQNTLPEFLKEANIKLGEISRFLENRQPPIRNLEGLETAYRAARVLQEASRRVAADSINAISQRLEALLDKHLVRKTSPTRVEIEAMQLATEWLAQLLEALRDQQPESKTLVAEALRAMALAEHFPGATPLVELLDSDAENRAPQLDDPFAADPGLQLDDDDFMLLASDPFAGDPDFGLGLTTKAGDEAIVSDDPFSEDAGFDKEFLATEIESTENGILPEDPFAEDPSIDERSVSDAAVKLQHRDFVCCVFDLCGRTYSLPINHMVEISQLESLQILSRDSSIVKGKIELNGHPVWVVNLADLHQDKIKQEQQYRLVVSEWKGKKLAFLSDGAPYLSVNYLGETIDLPGFISNQGLLRDGDSKD